MYCFMITTLLRLQMIFVFYKIVFRNCVLEVRVSQHESLSIFHEDIRQEIYNIEIISL